MTLHDRLRILMLPLDKIDAAIPNNASVVDLGCGEGIISKYLAAKPKRKITGVDLNAKRIPKLRQKNLKFINADITKYKFSKMDAVVISDVLHHLSQKDQSQLIAKVAKALRKNGLFIIKEIDTGEFIRSSLSRFWDFVLYPKDKIHYHDSKEFKKELERLGFDVELSRPTRLFPGSTTLFICSKK